MNNDKGISRGHVFVLDDDEAVLDSLSQLLRLNNFDVHPFGTAGDFERNYDGLPGCLLLDIHLPKADGLALAKDKIVGKLPLGVIFMSGSVDPEKIKRASEIGCRTFLRKPFAEAELIADVERSLRNLGTLAPTRVTEPTAGRIKAVA